jgi:phosphoglycolate phosphatase-like HAD superfamily hydrolase
VPSRRAAVLFDVDGTLVDTNYFHTLSWWRALRERDLDVPMSRIHRVVGMGSGELLEALLGEEPPGVRNAHSRHFATFKGEIRAFPRAGELLAEVARRGGYVVLATSAKEKDLQEMLDAIGAQDAVDGIVHAGDVDRAKPAPDVFTTALERFDLEAAQTLVVGDTVWDVSAAQKAALRCVGVTTGGSSERDLRDAGALDVYDDVGDLLGHFDESPLGLLLATGDDAP